MRSSRGLQQLGLRLLPGSSPRVRGTLHAILGCLVDSVSMIVITVPVLDPVLLGLLMLFPQIALWLPAQMNGP